MIDILKLLFTPFSSYTVVALGFILFGMHWRSIPNNTKLGGYWTDKHFSIYSTWIGGLPQSLYIPPLPQYMYNQLYSKKYVMLMLIIKMVGNHVTNHATNAFGMTLLFLHKLDREFRTFYCNLHYLWLLFPHKSHQSHICLFKIFNETDYFETFITT